MRPAWTTEIISVSGSVYSVNKVTDFAKFMKGWLIFQLKWFQIHAFVNLFIFFTLHLHGNIRTVSDFRFKKRFLAKVKKKCLKSLSKSHSCPCGVFQTRHTSKFCSAKKMAVSPCFVSVLLLEESFVVTYNNSRVRRVNSFQTSLFSPKIMKFIFFIHKRKLSDIFYQNLYALQEQFQSSLKVVR